MNKVYNAETILHKYFWGCRATSNIENEKFPLLKITLLLNLIKVTSKVGKWQQKTGNQLLQHLTINELDQQQVNNMTDAKSLLNKDK